MRRSNCIRSSALPFLLVLLLFVSTVFTAMTSESSAHIVYTENPVDGEPEAVHLRTLASVLGSEEAAKESLIYVYKAAATGFSAKLTSEQAAELSKQPGVLQVVPSQKMHLHSGGAAGIARLH